MMPKLSIGIWPTLNLGICGNDEPDPVPFMVHAQYSYIYMPISIILLNTSDSNGV